MEEDKLSKFVVNTTDYLSLYEVLKIVFEG